MTIHFPPAVEELLDCRYGWCGRTGAHGFKTDDHRREHYRKVHTEGFRAGRSGTSTRRNLGPRLETAASTKHLSVDLIDGNTPVQLRTAASKLTAREKSVPSLGNLQTPGLSAEATARVDNPQLPKDDNPPDQETAESKHSVLDSGSVMPDALGANIVESMECIATPSDGTEIGFGTSSDQKSVHERWQDGILDDRAECGHLQNPETFLCRNESLVDLMHPANHKLAVLESQVLESLTASEVGQYRALLEIQYDLLGFMQDQFRDNDFPNTTLGRVVTISGSAKHAQATSCSEYIQQNWPINGSKVLDALQCAFESPTHTSQSELVDDEDVFSDSAPFSHAHLKVDVTLEHVVLNIISCTQDTIVDVIQQLAWMGAALRTSKDGRVQYCESKLQGVGKARGVEPAMFNLRIDIHSPGEDDQSCWFSLFTNPVIALGFPTARRNKNEVGLEIPLDMMAALGGASHAAEFEGGLVLKGYSTLFVPTRRHEDSVQWHFIYDRGQERISYHQASLQCPNRVLLKDLNHETLRTTRAFLGWWKEAETHLGTANANYKSIDWSKAKEAGPSLRLTGVTLGFSKMISTQMNFALGGKDGLFHYSQDGPFQKTINHAENLPVVLYDQKDRRAWLVPALPVILHIIQLQNHLQPFIVGGNKVTISPLDPSRQSQAAKEAVARNKSQKLFDCEANEDKEYFFRDAVLDIWSIFDRLMEREATTQATPGARVNYTWHKILYGWEFRAIADDDTLLKQKRQALKRTAGRWYDLVKEVDAVVLFASGLGDIIKPRSDLDGLCRKWRSLPKDKDYLAVCVPMLEKFYAKAGHRQDHQYLTSTKLQWHRGSTIFEQCAGIALDCDKCDRLQQIFHESYKTIWHGKPSGKLEASGCVVFGHAHHPFKPTKIFAMREKAICMILKDSIQGAEIANRISGVEDGVLSPRSPTPLSPQSREVNGYEAKTLRRTPSPQSFSDGPLQENAAASQMKCQMTHAQTPTFDTFKHGQRCGVPTSFPDEWAVYPVYAAYPTVHQSTPRHDAQSNGYPSGYTQNVCVPKAEYAPVYARKTIRHTSRLEEYGHRYGCTCTTCSSVEFEPPDSIEFVATTNGTRRKSMGVVERRGRQRV
ncbi:hypothetical protein IMSHALPRED_003684 [Imshaugia aleurites]|uniref:Uncharacterized protein n=1 Tax=Imshaugia aleurites TaxID=172621 RepID=A0A8H3J895_9LECA|nr:hypothetical protein IMSHALPRED_003684 [Imshaugia aleurites]